MKKILTILILSVGSSFVFANDELTQQLDDLNYIEEINFSVETYITTALTQKPNMIYNIHNAPCHTYIWYLKNDFNNTNGAEKLDIFKTFETLLND